METNPNNHFRAIMAPQLWSTTTTSKIMDDLVKAMCDVKTPFDAPDRFSEGWNAAMKYIRENPMPLPQISSVIFHDPATIVYWSDGTKTVVKCQAGDMFSAETGLTTAMLKKFMGNDNTFNRVINDWLKRTGYYHKPALPAPAEAPALPESSPEALQASDTPEGV